jgi:hypothetical protein
MEEKTLQQSLAELKRILNLVEEKAQYAQYKHLLQKGIDSAAWTLNTTLGVIQHSENRDHVRTRLHIVNLNRAADQKSQKQMLLLQPTR